jgi:hypothetical protein
MNEYVLETIESEHFIAEIVADSEAEPPFEGDEPFKIAYLKSSRYTLGTEAVSEEEMEEIAKGIKRKSLIGLPVYAYIHGGATIRAGSGNPFSCPWDSGQSGFVYISAEDAKKEYKEFGVRYWRKAAEKCCRGVVEDYDQYLTGDVWGIVIKRKGEEEDPEGEEIESVWGFYGSEYATEEAKRMLDWQEGHSNGWTN